MDPEPDPDPQHCYHPSLSLAAACLRDLFEGKVPTKHENKLRLCFKDLMKKSGDALKRNRQFIKKDQEAYQTELENRYKYIHRQ